MYLFIVIILWCSELSNSKQKRSTRVDQKKIKKSWKEYVTSWTCFEFWPIINIFQKLLASESLSVACLQNYLD